MNRAAGEVYPVLPLRDIVVFPHMIVPLFVGRERSVKALEDVMKEDKQILLIAQKNAEIKKATNSIKNKMLDINGVINVRDNVPPGRIKLVKGSN